MPKLSPLPWEYENVSWSSERSGTAVVKDATGKTIFDTHNSDVVVVRVEHDEYGATYYDDQGAVDLAFAAHAANCHADLLAAVRAIESHWSAGNFSREPHLWDMLRAAIAKAEPTT